MNRHDFINWHEDIRIGTRRLIAMVPDEAFDYKPHEDSPTLEQLMRVFASLEEQFMKGVCRSDWTDPEQAIDARRQLHHAFAEDTDDLEGLSSESEQLDSVDEILDRLDSIHQEALDLFADVTDEEFLNRKVQVPWGEEATIQRLLVGMVEREIHHRTELFIALRQYGLKMSGMILWGP